MDSRSTVTAVPRYSTVAAKISIHLQCILMVDVCVTTLQL